MKRPKVVEQTKLILQIFREGFALNHKVTYFEALHGIAEKVQVIIGVILPAVIVDCIVNRSGMFPTLGFILLYAFAFSVSGLLERSCKLLQEAHGFKSVNLFRSKINQKSMRVDFKDMESPEALDMLSVAKESLWEFTDVGYVLFNDILGSLIALASMAYIILSVNIWIFLFILVLVVLNVLLERKKIQADHRYQTEETEKQRKTQYCSELMHDRKLGKEIRIFNAKHFILSKYRECFGSYQNIRAVREKSERNYTIPQKVLEFLSIAAIYLFAIAKYSMGLIGIGSFLLYVNAVRELSNSISGLFHAFMELSQVSLYYEDYRKYMELKETMRDTTTGVKMEDTVNRIELIDVSFRYPGRQEYALKNINLSLQAGTQIAFVGENGSGKTTLTKLILRLYDPTEGCIRLNGVDIRAFEYDAYLSILAAVFQDFCIFAYSIEENICFGMPDREEEINALLRDFGLEERIAHTPNGLQTYLTKELTDDGIDLSGGEKQKLAIIRGLYKNAAVLILDEPTAALDPIAEYETYHQIFYSYPRQMKIYISHRMSSTRFCDVIYVLQNGRICEMGTHEKLMENNGIYYDMFLKQAAYYK